jgi:hypothetical protein
MCKKNGESVYYLLFHSDVAYTIWIDFFSHFSLSWVMPRHVVNMYACCMEDGAYIPFMVFMERNERQKF